MFGSIVFKETMKGNNVEELIKEVEDLNLENPENLIFWLVTKVVAIDQANQKLRQQNVYLTTAVESLVRVLSSDGMAIEKSGVFSRKPLDVGKFVEKMREVDLISRSQDHFDFAILKFLKKEPE